MGCCIVSAAGAPGLRLLSVVTQLETGGAQTVAIELHREFLRRGTTSELVFLYEKDSAAFPKRDYRTLLDRSMRSPLDLAKITARLRSVWAKFQPTSVIAHTHFTNNMCGFVAKAAPGSARIIAVHHNMFESYPRSSKLLDRIAASFGLYDHEVSVSQPVLRSLPPGSAERRSVILNGQSLSHSALDRASARKAFGLPADAFLIGNIGRMAEQKNQAFLVDLLARVPDAHVSILGDGHLRPSLVLQAEALGVRDRLHLIGTVVHERVPDFLRALDLFAMPSLHEGMSIAMLEALSAGIPFLGSDVPTIMEVVNGGDGGAGIALPLEADHWVAAIARLRDPVAHAALAARQRARAENFSIETMADQYLAVAAGLRG